jgi:hypothetical protein
LTSLIVAGPLWRVPWSPGRARTSAPNRHAEHRREQLAVLEGHQTGVFGGLNGICPVTVDGRELLASVDGHGTVQVWDLATRQALALMRVEKPIRACARIGSDGLAAAGEGGLYGFDIVPGANPG